MWYYYLILNALIISFPLLASFEKRIRYYKKWKALGMSLLVVSTTYIVWDIIVTHIGHWSFNPKYVLDSDLLFIPLEEVLFFITVPYSCIFVYESILVFLGDKEVFFNRYLYSAIGIVFILVSFIFFSQGYTFIVLNSVAAFFIISAWFYPHILKARAYWIYILITFGLFFIFNYILTSVPIVLYGSNFIWDIRVLTIPLEDFFYNFSMLSLYLMVYLYFKKLWGIDADSKYISMEIGTERY
jgi:lycopene cyclase domain-containing protein